MIDILIKTKTIISEIKRNKKCIKKIKNNHYDFDVWELPEKYYHEVKKLKKRNKKLMKKLFKIYNNEK